MSATSDLLYEIGCEELPSSFVNGALEAMPKLARKHLAELRLEHGAIRALGTPRRLTLIVEALQRQQPDLQEDVTGPPVRAAFKDGQPTRAAEAFAKKLGCSIDDLTRVDTPKGEYLAGTRHEQGRPAAAILPQLLAQLTTSIPFRKSMRWGSGTLSFGRPIRWLVALLDGEPLHVELENLRSGRTSYGHRFLHPGAIELTSADAYVAQLREARVAVDPTERAELMRTRLAEAATKAGGQLIEDEFLIGENLSLVEEPQVIVGGFDADFLSLPDEVILEVARGHQRYFGLRDAEGDLMPKYLAVVNTAENPANIQLGNDRVMRARLADAQFFHREDLKRALADRRKDLAGIVFQKRLGTVLDKVQRLEKLVPALATLLKIDDATSELAQQAAALCKCDLVSLMVGEFPGLQGDVGRAYALEQDIPAAVADAIRDHYKPKGASSAPADSTAAALVALADRIDTLAGCFGIGLSPTGAADPYGLRRACIGSLRTLLHGDLDLPLTAAFRAAHAGFAEGTLDADADALSATLLSYTRDRLRGLLQDSLPNDAVNAALGVAADRPLDARHRAQAIAKLDGAVRARVGEVFKRATNIAKNAPEGEPSKGEEPSEIALYDAFYGIRDDLEKHTAAANYGTAFEALSVLAQPLADYFDNVLVMADDEAMRNNRLRLMRAISETCSALAQLELLGAG